jgi:hypothetical protein
MHEMPLFTYIFSKICSLPKMKKNLECEYFMLIKVRLHGIYIKHDIHFD